MEAFLFLEDTGMIGLGTWKFSVKTTYYSGDFLMEISEDNGRYKIIPKFPGLMTIELDYNVLSVTEKGDTLFVEATSNIIPGNRPVRAQFLFRGDICNVEAEIPFLGKTPAICGQRV